MYINPETNIRILKGVPLDPSYKDTIRFTTISNQYAYFASKAKFNLNDYSYQRVKRGWIRVGIKAESLYDCNYIMFNNLSFGNKWFYAFIKSVEYVNNICSEIEFEIDVLQTWYFDYTLKPCMVERQHTRTDEIYEYYEPENIDYGEMTTEQIYNDIDGINWNTYNVVMGMSPTRDTGQSQIPIQNGMISDIEYYSCEANVASFNAMKDSIFAEETDKNQVVSNYLFPKYFVGNDSSFRPTTGGGAPLATLTDPMTLPETVGNYRPKNKRLFSSPFTVIEVTDNCGASTLYKPELFSHNSPPRFNIVGKFIGSPEIMVYPLNYKGETYNYSESLTIGDFPMLGMAIDSYRAWLAMNRGRQLIDTAKYATQAIKGVGSIASDFSDGSINASPSLGGGLLGLASIANNINVAMLLPNRVNGRDSSDVMACMRQKKPIFKVRTISNYYAKMIDDYFTRYGYAISDLKVPETYARTQFTYVKTNGCIAVSNSMPSDDLAKIRSIFDNGITWWVDADKVGNYFVVNTPLGEL